VLSAVHASQIQRDPLDPDARRPRSQTQLEHKARLNSLYRRQHKALYSVAFCILPAQRLGDLLGWINGEFSEGDETRQKHATHG
jgi:hypothetical protein